jgi:hypothetical protein
VSVNGAVATVVNKPTVAGSPSSTSVSIPAPAGNDSFAFTAWDELNGLGNALDRVTATEDIIANANNTVSVTLDGVCAALVPSLATSSVYAETTVISTPLTSGTRTVLKAARLVGNIPQSFTFTPVDADGNTILTGANTVPISVVESGPTHHVTIAASASGPTNTTFTVTPLVAEPDGFSTQLTASSPSCGSGTTTLPNAFALSTSADVLVADSDGGVFAFDQDGTYLATMLPQYGLAGIAYDASANYLVAINNSTTPTSNGQDDLITFQTFTPSGTLIGSGSITPNLPSGVDAFAGQALAYNPTDGDFVIGIDTVSGSTFNGAIQLAAISGSTATLKSSNFSGTSNPCFAIALANGNVIVGDYDTDMKQFDANGNLMTTLGDPVDALTLDTTRGNLIAGLQDPAEDAFYDDATIFTTAGTEIAKASGFAQPRSTPPLHDAVLAYSAGNDELYIFSSYGVTFGMSGSSMYHGGTTTSNLPVGAFSATRTPVEAVAIP